jgi:hypothetical protein
MLSRRRFLKVFGLAGVAFFSLPTLFLKKSVSSPLKGKATVPGVTNWLHGSSRKGCSTSRVALDYHGSLEDGLDDFLNFRIPAGFSSEFPHGQYLS